MAQQCRGAADLAVAPLAHHHLQAGGIGARAQHPQLHRLGGLAVEPHAAAPALQGGAGGLALHPHPVGLAVAIAGMGELQGEIALVAEQQGAAAVGVEPAHRMQARVAAELRWQQIEHGGATDGITAAAQHSHRFVEQQHQGFGWGGEGLAGHRDPVVLGVGLVAQLGGFAVHGHQAIAQQLLGPTPGAQAGIGDQFLEPLGHRSMFPARPVVIALRNQSVS